MTDTVIMIRRAVTGPELEECFGIRTRVFIEGQGVPRHEEMDGRDRGCAHFLAEVEDRGRRVAVGTSRLRITADGHAKLERLAVLDGWQGKGIGRALVVALETEAVRSGHREVVLGAQLRSMGFYERCGYVAEGGVFDDAGIPHRLMRKDLAVEVVSVED